MKINNTNTYLFKSGVGVWVWMLLLASFSLFPSALSYGAEEIKVSGTVNIAPAHPRDGNDKVLKVLMPVEMGQEAEPLQGATYRGCNNHTGEFKASGVPKVKGVKWTFRAKDKIRCSPVVVDDVCYVGSHDGNLYAIDAESGKEKWRFETGGKVYSSPTVYDGIVYFGSNDGSLYAVKAADGTEVWNVRGDGESKTRQMVEASTQGGGQVDVAAAPVVAYGCVFVSLKSRIRGFDLKTGEEKWVNLQGGNTQGLGTITIWQGKVYYGYSHCSSACFDLKFGRKLFGFTEIGNDAQSSTFAMVDGRVYRTGLHGNAYCDDATTENKHYWHALAGSSQGRTNPGHKGGAVVGRWYSYTSPAVADGVLTFGTSGGYLSGIDMKTGKEIWLKDLGEDEEFRCPASIADGKMYIGGLSGTFYCLDLKTGDEIWKEDTGAGIVGAPYIGDGFAVVGNDAGEIICYQ